MQKMLCDQMFECQYLNLQLHNYTEIQPKDRELTFYISSNNMNNRDKNVV